METGEVRLPEEEPKAGSPWETAVFPSRSLSDWWEHRYLALNTGAAGSRQADPLLFCLSMGKEGTNLEFEVQWVASSHWSRASLLTPVLKSSTGAHTSLADSSAMEPRNTEQT